MDFRKRVVRAVIALAILAPPVQGAVENSTLEYSVKAAFLFKFGGFIEWPESVFDSPESPTHLCIVGDDPFGAALEKAVAGQRIANHLVEIKRMPEISQKSGCQIAFLGGKDAAKIANALEAVRGENVVTITDGAPTPESTGIINFVIADNRVRFEIDDQAASVNGVTISSKLLDLAKTTKRRG